MSEAVIREYRPADLAPMARLWGESFGDGEGLIRDFYRLLPGMGSAVCAWAGERLLGMAHIVDGLDLSDAGKRRNLGYLYAVAVAPEARGRGLGEALCRAAVDLGRKRGALVFCTQPAEPSLFAWYKRSLGLDCVLRRETLSLEAAAPLPHMALSVTDYGFWRERLLADRPHLRLCHEALQFQLALCQSYGGGFYLMGDGLAAVYREGDAALVRELLVPAGTDPRPLAAALGGLLGTSRVLLNVPGDEGEPYLAGTAGELAPGTVWGPSFD